MSEEKCPDGEFPIQEDLVKQMNELGHVLCETFNPGLHPKRDKGKMKFGFALLVFEFKNKDGLMNYISNADRVDMIQALRNFIRQNQKSLPHAGAVKEKHEEAREAFIGDAKRTLLDLLGDGKVWRPADMEGQLFNMIEVTGTMWAKSVYYLALSELVHFGRVKFWKNENQECCYQLMESTEEGPNEFQKNTG